MYHIHVVYMYVLLLTKTDINLYCKLLKSIGGPSLTHAILYLCLPNFTELSIEWHSRASPILARRNIDRGYTCNTYLLYVVHVCT